MTLAAVLCCTALFTSCNKDTAPAGFKDLSGTWVTDLSGKTMSIWNYGKAWNAWTFNADGTGVCDVFFLAGDEPVAIQHQPFTYTAENGKLVTLMDDGPWEWTYKTEGGKLKIGYEGGGTMTFDKADAAQVSRFGEWGQRELLAVPGHQARYTIFVYGNCGKNMDIIFEKGFLEAVRPYLKDSSKVRVAILYKYGQNTSGQMTDDGDVVWFELDSETDLDNLRTEGLNGLGMHTEAIATKLYDPNTIHRFIEFSSLFCPAEEYIFTIWGHGNGFDPMRDLPGKYTENPDFTKGVIGDEWNNDEQLDMYELAQGIKATGRAPLKAIFFNNCLMGNMESLTELRDVAEYIACSSHTLSASYIILPSFIKGLIEKDNVEDAFAYMLDNVTPDWQNSYRIPGVIAHNGDFKLLRASSLDGIIDVAHRLASRLVALYPTHKEAIDRATCQVYRFYNYHDESRRYITPFFDLQDYADKLAANTDDAFLAAIAQDLKTAFGQAFVQSVDVNWCGDHLDHYSLSVCLYDDETYHYDFLGTGGDAKSNIGTGYEQCTFHQLTGWGDFLSINTCPPTGNPECGGGGML